MTAEVLFLAIACGMTLLAYMVAINAHGPTRLSLSYLIATIMLAATVWGIVQYVNAGQDIKKMAEFKQLEMEKRLAEERVKSQEEALRASREKMGIATNLNQIIATGTGYTSSLINVDLQDRSADLETLMGRAADIKQKAKELKNKFEKMPINDDYYTEATEIIKNAIQSLSESAYYYRAYYYSENSEQEQLRERVLRQKARKAYDDFQKASSQIVSSGIK
jgi:leucyl aminopeptidase